jgi:hypothetical protein
LALSSKQQKAIDKAFEKGVRAAGGKRKRRKAAPDVTPAGNNASDGGGFLEDGGGSLEDGGGFVDDGGGGGFIADDDDVMGGGGFLPDDEDAGAGGGGFVEDDNNADADMGGFVPDDEPLTSTRPDQPETARIPLRVIPGLLGALGLPVDEDVLAVFKASASGWDDEGEEAPSRRRKRGEEEQTGGSVSRRDFRAVCAALMGPDEGGGDGDEGDDAESSSSGEDAFKLDEGDESESSLSSAFSDPSISGKGKGKAKATSARRSRKNKDLEEEEKAKLSSRQKEMVGELWRMIKPSAGERGGGRALSRDEVKLAVRNLGEMWIDEEVS